MILRVNITEDHIKLIKSMWVQEFSSEKIGVRRSNPFMGSAKIDDMALVLGYKPIDGIDSHYDFNGAIYSEEDTKRLNAFADDFEKNLTYYEEILHQHCDTGIQVGTYKCYDNEHIWSIEDESKKI